MSLASEIAHDDKMVKKSVTIRRSVAEEVEARTGKRDFSRFVNEALERQLALLKAGEIVRDFEQQHGPLTDEDRDEAQRAWRGQ
ncbi:hypothetical protein [Nonomuraea sediminis]|uniref:hypothetical protein n=1 Tax=Nonomuraea sediminis TaxID=2835864 RepID=UPI00202A8263|nr:hypothetical protein [Nonomuraea sediminis]